MAINFHTLVYQPVFDTFARPVIFTPIASQPLAIAYTARGIYDTRPVDVLAQDGAVLSDQQSILDILEEEFGVLPVQLDRVSIPAVDDIPAVGDFEIMDADSNGGGETTLTLRRLVVAAP